MTVIIPSAPISPLRQRLIDDMTMRRFSRATQRNYIRDVGRFATFLGRSPDTATAEDIRRFQVDQREAGVPVPTMNSIVSEDCQEFRVWAGIMGKKESPYVPTQRTIDTERSSRPAPGRGRCQCGV